MSTVTALKKKVKPEEGGFDLGAVLAGATVPKESKAKKSSAPVLVVGDDVKILATRVREVKEQLDSAESMYETLGAELIGKVSPLRDDLCKKSYQSSVRVPDTKGLSIGISWADKYCAIPPENEDALRDLAGETYADYFTSSIEVSVRDISEESLTELVKAVGPERFARFFSVTKTVKPTTRFTMEQFNVFTPEQRQQFTLAGVKQFKPSIKVK
jgi:hypothetical protein